MEQIKKRWGVIAEGAAFLVSIIAGFVVLPAKSNELSQVIKIEPFSVFIVSVLAAFFLIAASKWKQKKHFLGWGSATLVFAIGLIVGIYYYSVSVDEGVCRHIDRVYFMGAYTEVAQGHKNANPEKTCEDMLGDYQFKDEHVWTRESMDETRRSIIGLYLITITLGALTVMGIIQTIYTHFGKAELK